MENYLRATEVIDCDSLEIRRKALSLSSQKDSYADKAVSLYYFVRDEIKYRIAIFEDMGKAKFRATLTLKRGYGFCMTKAILLVALSRATGIPARLHFCDIRNHLLPQDLLELVGTDIIIFHGYADLFLNGRWIKANPAFDIDLCRENEIVPVDFSGDKDAVFHPVDLKRRHHIEYIRDRGSFDDLPLEMILSGLREFYGPLDKDKIAEWNGQYY